MTHSHQAFEALLTAFPALRLRRQISAQALRLFVARRKGDCTICGLKVPRPRRHYCSEACVQEFMIRCMPGAGMRAVKRRDKGVCSVCGLDTKQYGDLPGYFRRMHQWRIPRAADFWAQAKRSCCCFGCVTAREADLLACWEADHIIPVIEGGGLCGPNGLRTLCLGCHRAASRELAGRQAAKRRQTA